MWVSHLSLPVSQHLTNVNKCSLISDTVSECQGITVSPLFLKGPPAPSGAYCLVPCTATRISYKTDDCEQLREVGFPFCLET